MKNSFIDPNVNDNFSYLRGLDLQELLLAVEKSYIKYRLKLGLPYNLTFGVELEYEGIFKFISDGYIKRKLYTWDSKRDGSLFFGGEITSPVMCDKEMYWKELKMVCTNLRKRGAVMNKNAGGHIHIGSNILGKDIEAWRSFIKVYILYEPILFRFLYGDKLNGRKGIKKYATPNSSNLYRKLDRLNRASYYQDFLSVAQSLDRYAALNLSNVSFFDPTQTDYKNTIEFRAPNASDDHIICQNNINALAKFLVSSSDNVFDEEFLNYKLSKYEENRYNELAYNEIMLQEALEFVDLIFDNNLDKVYFLRQYLKSFQDNYGFSYTVKAKKFTR